MKPDPSIAAQSGDAGADTDRGESVQGNTLEVLSGDLRKHEAHRSMPSQIGDYELIGEIARGGMGVVYKARQQSLGRTVAVKMILDSALVSDQQIKRFRGEAEAAARLDHSGIVPVYEVGEADGRHFFSMALLEGGSLQSLVARGPLAPQAAAEMVAQIATAVDYAHQQGVVHRDLKPQNILLDKQGQPKVTDFGLARRLDSVDGLTRSGDVVGTPGYMSPEQALGRVKEVGPLADVYSLGAILYCLLTGHPPFQAATLAETLRQISEQEPVSPRLVNPSTPRDLETICLKAMQKDKARRYGSAQALADDLRRNLRGETILARPISIWEKGWRFCRRKPALAGLMGAVVAMVLAAVALVVVVAQLRVASADAEAQHAKLDALESAAKARDAELQLQRRIADTQKYYALLAEVRQNATARKPGWTWINQQKLAEAAALDTPVLDKIELRTQAAECLGAFDLREAATFDSTFPIAALACAPSGKWIASAQLKDWLACTVLVTSLPEGEVLHKLRFPSSHYFQATSSRQDGTASMAVSDDSRWIAVGTRSGMIYLWDLQSPGSEPRSWECDKNTIEGLRFHPDNERLLSCSSGGVLKCWSLKDLQGTDIAADLGSWSNLPVSPDGKVFVSYRDLRSTSDFSKLGELEAHSHRMAFHPGGSLLAQAWGSSLKLIDVATGKVCRTFADPDLAEAHDMGIGSIAFHPQGSWLASCDSQRLKVWEVASGTLVGDVVVGPTQDGRLTFTADGGQLIAAGDHKLVVFELAGLAAQSFIAHEPLPITAVDVARDDRGLATLSEGMRSAALDYHAEVSTWELASGKQVQRSSLNLPRSEAVFLPSIAFDRQGELLAVAPATGDLRLLATTAGEPLASIDDSSLPAGAALIDEASWELREDGEAVSLRDDPAALNKRAVRIAPDRSDFPLRFHPRSVEGKQSPHVAYVRLRLESPNPYGAGCRTVVAADDRAHLEQERRGADLADGKYHWCKIGDFESPPAGTFCSVVTLPGGPAVWVDAFAYGPMQRGGGLIPTADGERLWGMAGKEVVSWHIPSLEVRSRFTSADSARLFGRSDVTGLAVCGQEAVIALSDKHLNLLAADGSQVKGAVSLDQAPTALAIASDQTWCAVGTLNSEVRLVSLPEGEEIHRVDHRADSVVAIAISEDQAWLATASKDRQLLLWQRDPAGLKKSLSLALPGKVRAIRFSPAADKLLILLDAERAVRVWDLKWLREQTELLMQPARSDARS